jgi:hypothetical protein
MAYIVCRMSAIVVIAQSNEYLIATHILGQFVSLKYEFVYRVNGSFTLAHSRVNLLKDDQHGIFLQLDGSIIPQKYSKQSDFQISLLGEKIPDNPDSPYTQDCKVEWTKEQFLKMPAVEAQSFINLITGARLFLGRH